MVQGILAGLKIQNFGRLGGLDLFTRMTYSVQQVFLSIFGYVWVERGSSDLLTTFICGHPLGNICCIECNERVMREC